MPWDSITHPKTSESILPSFRLPIFLPNVFSSTGEERTHTQSALTCNLNSFLDPTHRAHISVFIIALRPIYRFFYSKQITHYSRDGPILLSNDKRVLFWSGPRACSTKILYGGDFKTTIGRIVKHRLNRFVLIESSNCNDSLEESEFIFVPRSAFHCPYYRTGLSNMYQIVFCFHLND